MENQNTEVTVHASQYRLFSLKGIAEVFYKPAEFFTKLKDNPKIFVPYVVFVLLTFASLFLLKDLIVETQTSSPQFAANMEKSGQSVTPELISIMKISTLVIGTIAMSLYPLVVAALALFFGNFVMAGKGSFKKLLSVALYGGILYVLGSMILIPMMLAKNSMMVSFSLAVFATDYGMESILYTALSKISIFQIWKIIVVGIGLSTIYNFPRNKGYVLAVLSVGLLSVLQIVFAAIGAMFT